MNFKQIDFLREERKISIEEFSKKLGYKSRQGYTKGIDNNSIRAEILPIAADVLGMDFYEFMKALDPEAIDVAEDRAEFLRAQSLASCDTPFRFLEILYERREELEKSLRGTAPK